MKTEIKKQETDRNYLNHVSIQFCLLAVILILIAAFSAHAQTIAPVKYWTFNGTNVTADSMGGPNLNFNYYNTQYTVGTNGQVGKYVTFGNGAGLVDGGSLNLTNALTIEFLFKPGYKFNTSNMMQRADGAFHIKMEYAKITFSTAHKNSSGNTVEDNFTVELNGVGRKSYSYYVDEAWHHMVFVFNATTGVKQIWVDGQLPSGFSKTITPGTFSNNGSTNFYLNHSVNYVKYYGSIDELALYNTALPASLIYKHYLGVQNGQPYSFTNNYQGTIPPASPVTAPVDPLEFAPGHPSVTMPATEQINKFPTPRYKPGHTLLRNVNWMDPKFMGGLYQPGVTNQQAANNGAAMQVELAKNFNYYFNVEFGNNTFANTYVNTANANPDLKLAILIFRQQLNGNNPEINNQNKPNSHYLQNANGEFIDVNGNVTTRKIWRPTAPPSSYNGDGNAMLASFTDMFTRLNRGLDLVNDNGELFPLISDAAMAKDPVVTADKNASGLTWRKYLGRKFAENETQSFRNIFMAHPKLANAKFTEFAIEGYPAWNFDYSEARKVNSTINGQYYSTTSFYTRYPYNWRNWTGAWHGWQWIVESRVHELALGDRLHSPFISAGWDTNEENNIRPAQWLGLVKCVGMTGAEFYYTGVFSLSSPWPDAKNWVWQAVIPSYAQAVASRYEDFIRNGELMNGDVPNSYIAPSAPGYSFWTGDLRKLVVIRKHNSVNKYAITGTIQPNNNMINSAENEGVATITLDNQTLSFKVRRQGSSYIYDKSNPSAPVFYQLDGWHEKTHPLHWTGDFNLEAELFDNNNTQVTIKTQVPAGTAAGDYTNFTSYVAWPDAVSNPSPVEYQFTPRTSGSSSYYLWVRARSRGGITTSFNVQVDNNTSVSVGCISDTAWTWYRYDACTQQSIRFLNLTLQNHTLRITPGNSKLEIDQIILTSDAGLILNSAPPSCASATATITTNNSTTFCQGGSVNLTASSGTSYLWSPGGQTTQTITVSSTGTYNVTVGAGTGCSAIASPITVTVNANPTATITANGSTTLCSGQTVTLSAPAGAASYLWTPSAQNSQSITTGIAGNYTVRVTNANGCSALSNPIAVTVNQAPTATISANGATTFCQGGSVTLTAGNSNGYLWSPGGQTTQSITVISGNTYSVQVTNSGGCTSLSAPTVVTVNNIPTATITASGSTNLCNGESVTLTASSGSTYLWSNGANTQSINVSTGGAYAVSVFSAQGCSATSSPQSVTVQSALTPSITANGPTALQPGQSVTLTATGGTSYLWQPNGETTPSITVSTPGSYSVTAMNPSGCSGTSSPVLVTVNPLTGPPANITASGSPAVCPGQSLTLTASTGSAYLWTPGGQTTQSILVSSPGIYSVNVIDISGNGSSNAMIEISENPIPAPPAIMTSYIPNSAFQLTAYEPTAHTYKWSTGSTSQTITVNNTGTYSVIAINGLGCESAPETMVVNSTAPQPCGTPDMLSTYGITKTEATLSWNPAVTAQSFKVEYTDISSNVTKTEMVAGNVSHVKITGLNEGKSYKWVVTTICQGSQAISANKYFTTLNGPMPCGSTPQNLQTNVVNSTFAKVSWFDTQADRFVLRFREVGTTNYTYRRSYATMTEGTMMGLTPNTAYEWSVRSVCGTNASLYSTPQFFTTLPVCPSIGAVTVTEIGFNNARLSFSSAVIVDTLMIRYAHSGTTNYLYKKIPANPNPGNYIIQNLSPQTTYDAWVSTKCSSGSTSMWGQGVTFTTNAEPVISTSTEGDPLHLNAYPNPTKHQINYVFESNDDKAYTVKVCDMAGRELYQELRDANEGLHGERVDLAGFSNGMYMLIVQKGPVEGRFKFNIHK